MPKGQTDWSDIWALRAVVQGTGHMPIGLLALSFCECLRSVKQSRRLNLSAETGTAVVCVCVYVCMYVCMHACMYGILTRCLHRSYNDKQLSA